MKTKKNKQLLIDNLTYYRLQADLYAVEADITDNRPLEDTAETNILKKFMQQLRNEFKRSAVRDLTADKKLVLEELARFENEHKKNNLKPAQDSEKLKTFAQKKLFKKDKYDLNKIRFALAFATDKAYTCQRAEESLAAVSELLFDDPTYINVLLQSWQENFLYIHKQELSDAEKSFLLISELISPIVAIGGGIATFVARKRAEQQLKEQFMENEVTVNSLLALRLTLLQEAKTVMPEKVWKDMADEFLHLAHKYRADAEYVWIVEQVDAPACRQKIEVCNRAIERLSQIAGI